jgi:hygromycin-B 7''-O-kinase
MRGEREYEFAGVGVRRRLLAWAILHRYSNLRWWMQRLPEPSRATLDALADRWFATS